MKRYFLAIVCAGVVASTFLAGSFLAQELVGKLAGLIQDGKRTAAFDLIRSGADVNEAQLDGTRPVHWAVYRVDHELLAALIAKKAKVDVANEFGYTPLSEAVKQGDARMVEMLMDGGSGTEGANLDGQTALMIAIKNGDLAIFQMLIDAGAKVNVVEKAQDQTPLMWAAAATRNAAEMVKVLIAKGADVKARARFNDWPSQITSEPRAQYHVYGGLTPLLYAARGGCYACVEALVSAGADVNEPTPEGATPMLVALDNSQNGVAKFFLDHGGNPHLWDVYGRTPLYVAVDHAGAGAAGAPAGGGGGAPAGGGRGGGAAPAGGGRGAAPGAGAAPAGGRGAAPVAGAAPAAGGRGVAPVAGGAGLGAAPAGAGRGGAGAAPGGQGGRGAGGGGGQGGGRGAGGAGGRGGGEAVNNGPAVSSMEIINLLLAAGVDPNPQLNQRRPNNASGRFGELLFSNGTTPLFRAVVGGNQEIARLLLEKGANPNIYSMGLSPFLHAAGVTSGTYNENPNPRGGGGGGGGGGNVNTALLDLMIQHGADVNAQVNGAASYTGRIARALTNEPVFTKSNEGMTPLHVAVRSGNVTMVRYLLDHGARPDIVDGSGRTPLDVLNGALALQPAVFAEASGLVPLADVVAAPPGAAPGTAAPPAPAGAGARGGAGRGAVGGAAAPEIRTLLQAALQSQKK